MSEPLTWNALPAAAAWLSERCGRTLDASAVIDAVIRRSERAARTIIKAPVPPDCRVARIAFVGHMPDTEQVKFEHQLLEQQHGPLGTGMLYVRNEFPRVHCLCAAELTDLLLHGAIDVSLVRAPNDSNGNTIGAWLMPWGTKRTVSLDACGINRADLVALGDELAAGTPPEPAAPAPAATDFAMLATREQLIAAFGPFTGMDADWFRNLKDTPALLAARRITGQGGRGHLAEPYFCPFAVMQWLVDGKRKKGRALSERKGWELLERHFPKVYASRSIGDPREA